MDCSAFLTQPRAPGRFASSYRASSRRFEHRSGIVTVGPDVFVRSYRAEHGRWYQNVAHSKTFPLELGGELVSVRPDPVHDADVLEEVSKGLSRHSTTGSPSSTDMVSPPDPRHDSQVVPVGS